MFTNKCDDNAIPADRETCYEAVASQEEIYLEEVEEEVRVKLTSYEPARGEESLPLSNESRRLKNRSTGGS